MRDILRRVLGWRAGAGTPAPTDPLDIQRYDIPVKARLYVVPVKARLHRPEWT